MNHEIKPRTVADDLEELVRQAVAGIVDAEIDGYGDVFAEATSPVGAFAHAYELCIDALKLRGIAGERAHRVALLCVAGLSAQMCRIGILDPP